MAASKTVRWRRSGGAGFSQKIQPFWHCQEKYSIDSARNAHHWMSHSVHGNLWKAQGSLEAFSKPKGQGGME